MKMLLLAIVLIAAPVQAKDLFVNASTGNDATTYAANSAATPWQSIGRAAWGSTTRTAPNASEAARAGDVVRISAGTYTTVGGGDRWDVVYNPANNGTAAAPIRFEATGDVSLAFSAGDGPIIGANVRNYIEWSGFTIRETQARSQGDTGPVVFFGAQGGTLEHSTLIGNPNWTERVGDNYSGVRIHAARGTRILNNRITDFGGQSGDENHSGITTYWAADLTIRNNEFANCGAGIYLKGNTAAEPVSGYFDVSYNLFRNNTEGMRILLIPSTAAAPNLVSQNVFRQNSTGIVLMAITSDATAARYARMVNNTFVDNAVSAFSLMGTHVSDANHAFLNNIAVGGQYSLDHTSYQATNQLAQGQITYQHNLYNGFTSAHSAIVSGNFSLEAWKTTTGQDTVAPAAIHADPQFVDAAVSDYRLGSASPALTLGRAIHGVGGADGATIPAGAYITGTEVIGPGGTAPPPPPPPDPVDCAISAFTFTSATAWSACSGGTQTRTETWTATVTTPPSNGGLACPALTETRTVTQSCTVVPPPVLVFVCTVTGEPRPYSDGDLKRTIRCDTNGPASLPVGTMFTIPRP